MKFFNSPSRLYEFYKNFLKKNTSDIQKLYTQGELQLIAEDIISVTNTSLVTTNKSELIRNIKTIVNGWHSLDEDPLGDAFHGAPTTLRQTSYKLLTRKRTVTKPPLTRKRTVTPRSYNDMTVAELRTLLTSHQLYTSGLKKQLIQRLRLRDAKKLQYEDMSTEWLTIKLKSEQVVVPPSRTKMIELVRKGEHNPEELEIGDFNDKVVNDFWNKYHFPPTDNRAEKLTKLRIQQIKELRELVKHLDQELYKYQRDSRTVPSRTNRSSSSTSSGDSWSGAVTRGVVQGVTAVIISNLLSRHQLESKTNLVF